MSKSQREAVQRQFAKTVEHFSKLAVRDSPEILAEKVEFCRPQPTDLALDVACGPGTLVLLLAARTKFVRGIDVTFEMLRQARAFQIERQAQNVCFEQGDAEQLPYPDATFDLVTCQCSFHHMAKPEKALREMVRVLKTDGRMMITDPLGPESEAKYELHNQIERLRDRSHTESLRLTTFLRMFDDAALDVLRQTMKRRPRSFNDWMRRAGIEPHHKRYREVRRLMESTIEGDTAGFSPQPQGDDLLIVHNEGLFLLTPREAT